ncbi:MAG: response regulator, partial [Bacteroidota bacterium]
MTVAIIDDEKIARDTIRKLLELAPVTTQIVVEAANVQEGITLIEQAKVDILFLDINLGPQSGFDLLQKINHTNFHLVFTTAYDQFALKAFRFHATDYLLKPITPNKLN